MKPGFAVLPLEVWADVSEHPLITRQMLAQIADNNGDPMFTAKLQKLLHGCGKHSLRYLDIYTNQYDEFINKAADTAGDRGFINKFQQFLRDCAKQTIQYFGFSSRQPDKPTQEPSIQFLTATTHQSTFVIYLQFLYADHLRADEEGTFENATTKERLAIRNAQFKRRDGRVIINYVEIVRHPAGAEAKMREWFKQRPYYEQKYKEEANDGEADKVIWIYGPTIGRITKQVGVKPADVKRICLSRQSLEKIEQAHADQFGAMRRLLLGCLVRVNVQGKNLVGEIRDVEERMQYCDDVHFDRRLLLPQLGYFEFHQISDQSPTDEEIQFWVQRRKVRAEKNIQHWVQRRKLPLPGLDFLHNKIAKLKSILGDPAMNGAQQQEQPCSSKDA